MTSEILIKARNGWGVFLLLFPATLGLVGALCWSIHAAATAAPGTGALEAALPIVGASLLLLIVVILWGGFYTLQPNESAVLLLFGAYTGSARRPGLCWNNPFYSKKKISLRVRNFNGEKLKVNDQRGNPIEIAAVVVWRVADTAQAFFDVDDYHDYVTVQSESAVRHLASIYPYDSSTDEVTSLRGSMDEVCQSLRMELQERLSRAGVVVEEARLTHLAYAPEIAGAMLRRQQAEAVVAARMRIVEGAVGMVEIALERLQEKKTIELDPERKAAMISNLLVVLCGEQAAQPVVNTGTLYT